MIFRDVNGAVWLFDYSGGVSPRFSQYHSIHITKWSELPLDETDRAVLSVGAQSYQALVGMRYSPLSLNSRILTIDGKVEFVPSEDGEGATCATFIAMFLKHMEFPAVKLETWMPRSEDEQKQAELLTLAVASNDLTAAQELLIRAKLPVPRLRPEEMIGAAMENFLLWPIPFSKAEVHGKQVLQKW